jgi:hypothetical protein
MFYGAGLPERGERFRILLDIEKYQSHVEIPVGFNQATYRRWRPTIIGDVRQK